ncbi:MAG: hypothetical protein QG579_462 [Patescibacteria group bacterium]|nr:hypothetical protein [Patescibacteria group bacterium]
MIKNIIIFLIGITLILTTFYWYLIRPNTLSKDMCESTYRYHQSSTDGVPFNYHTAFGATGPITKFESKKEAIESCMYFHKKMYRSSIPFYLF